MTKFLIQNHKTRVWKKFEMSSAQT